MSFIRKLFGNKVETPAEAILRGQRMSARQQSESAGSARPPAAEPVPSREATDPNRARPPGNETEASEQSNQAIRTLQAIISEAAMMDWLEAVNVHLKKGFSELQQQVLKTKIGRITPDSPLLMHYHLFHAGSPCGLQLLFQTRGGDKLAVLAEGSGPVMDVLFAEFQKHAEITAETDPDSGGPNCDGRFRRDEDGSWWRAHLPVAHGLFAGHPLELRVEQGRPGIRGGGQVWESDLLKELQPEIPELLMQAEQKLQGFVGDKLLTPSELMGPVITLSAGVATERDWRLVVERSELEGFGWTLYFQGLEFLKIEKS